MLTGSKAFSGEDATEIISAVMQTTPAWTAIPSSVPPHVRTILERCLVKDRKTRIPDLSVVRFLLEGGLAGSALSMPAPVLSRASSIAWKVATLVLATTSIAGVGAWYRSNAVLPQVTRFLVSSSAAAVLSVAGIGLGPAAAGAISPDGRLLVFTATDPTGNRQIWVRPIDSSTAHPLSGTQDAGYPFWSPDSRFIGYSVAGKLMKVSAAGGPPMVVCALFDVTTLSRGGTWSPDGVIVFNNGPRMLYGVKAAGGDAIKIAPLADGEVAQRFPWFLPDGKHVLFHSERSSTGSGVYVTSIDGGEASRIVDADTGGVYDRVSGYLLFGRRGTLTAQAFDTKALTTRGDAVSVAEYLESSMVPGLVSFSVSDTGALAYGIGLSNDLGLQLVWLDRQGKTLGTVGPVAQYRGFALSPDGTLVAAHRHGGVTSTGDIWLTEVATGRTSRLTTDESEDSSAPVFSPDSRRVAFAATRNGKYGVYVKSVAGTASDETIVEIPAAATGPAAPIPLSWTPDQRSLVVGMDGEVKTRWDLWLLPVSGERRSAAAGPADALQRDKGVPLARSQFQEQHGQVSPNGK